ncbi:MAG: hypothetical protein KA200_00775 [Burkholderiales bacterium]|nr:hypothetical protein [Burkholderiales bacterium]
MSIPLPATEVAKLYAALDAAMTRLESQRDDDKLWRDLNNAKAFVKVYLLDQMPKQSVRIVQAQEAA